MKTAVRNLYAAVLLFLLVSTPLLVAASERGMLARSDGNVAFVLTVEDDRLSLHAQDASLHAILQEIGRQMAIEVIGNLPPEDEERVTVVFEQLTLEEALPRLSGNYGYQKAIDGKTKKITTLFALPKGQASGVDRLTPTPMEHEPQASGPEVVPEDTQEPSSEGTEKKAARPEPFNFSFDPGT